MRFVGTVLANLPSRTSAEARCWTVDDAARDTLDNEPLGRLTVMWCGLWLALAAGLMFSLMHYAATASLDRPGITEWPLESAIERAPERSTLLCFVHPRCACTEATLRELERVVSRSPHAAVRIIFREDPSHDLASARTWSLAESVPGAERFVDVEGREADRFGAATSGLVLLFDGAGALRFRGGITSSRGHEGDSAGARALESALRSNAVGKAAIFGCGLEES